MDGSQLGKKLKEARLAKKMTQSDVVGTFITRNMLSQIESGAAFPSLRTLEYLANKLEIPIHYLIPDGNTNEDVNNIDITPQAIEMPVISDKQPADIFMKCKTAFLKGDYTGVNKHTESLTDKNSFYYDEGIALLARACLKAAKSNGTPAKSAIAYARSAAEYAGKGIYASREVRTEALLLLDELSEGVKV